MGLSYFSLGGFGVATPCGGRRHVVRNEPDAGVWGRSLGCGASAVGLELGSVWRVSEERRDPEHAARRKPAGVDRR